ncbi:uncharacterized protein A1O9_06319 [Exophiala aquamarina CBS 119918]|uniref:D-xylose 1-dehydrogenase (NADP(+), D-xylono-1,5-lactone-forming) n=1 Tax=Exophiala aquamarina CBS 119918 TaxID=1182545 RepID=A0A072PGH4_9EURO|nr:uncharacterized protein A1O9_06319 [Exophiala aquamarina CBS 119918]KEF58393.1 hypothetical protein A1O9_06319 [Exophiala aquamarina CBS 119918]
MGPTDQPQLPTLRWGIISAGLISSWFVEDLLIERPGAQAEHIVQAIGCSSATKGAEFVSKYIPSSAHQPSVGTYEDVYSNPNVDVVYIGTPHAFHKKNCLDAIAAGKHVLCEKAFTITAKESREVCAAAKQKGVFVMEAMWLRFIPLVVALGKKLHEERVIGDVRRMFCDFGLNMNLAALGPESRLKNPSLGAGSLLDIGVYSLTWGLLGLDSEIGERAQKPKVLAVQSLSDTIDVASTFILQYSNGAQGVLTSTTECKSGRDFCRIEGTDGYITVEGGAASVPDAFTVHKEIPGPKKSDASGKVTQLSKEVFKFEKPGRGFYYEADAVALDIASKRLENAVMPHAETVRVMQIMDEIRKQGGTKFPQDDE